MKIRKNDVVSYYSFASGSNSLEGTYKTGIVIDWEQHSEHRLLIVHIGTAITGLDIEYVWEYDVDCGISEVMLDDMVKL